MKKRYRAYGVLCMAMLWMFSAACGKGSVEGNTQPTQSAEGNEGNAQPTQSAESDGMSDPSTLQKVELDENTVKLLGRTQKLLDKNLLCA
ncbi:MAG: hypothetical protein K2O03_07980, partial [Lachnospiraceae bacterium]|nr:hypothetical protein [Lachnospiraceae bacterium]